MTKTKRQLRAEAVERLKRLQDRKPLFDSDVGVAIADGMLLCEVIDLLTDDEPPEGDGVKLLRDLAAKPIYRIDAPEADMREWLNKAADMVERDYVRRDAVEGNSEWVANLKCSEWMEKAHKLERECDELASDLYAEHALVIQLQSDVERLQAKVERLEAAKSNLIEKLGESNAERDEWMAKAEGANDELPEGGEMSGTLRETPEFAENPQKSARNGKNDDFNDTREKLLMDIQQESYMFYTTNGEGPCAKSVPWSSVLRWLDRQAAITEREVTYSYERTAERQSNRIFELHNERADALRKADELTAKVEELEAERDTWKNAAGNAHEMWEAEAESTAELLREVGRLRAKVDELRAELDQWEKMADGIELPDYPAAKFVPMDVYPESTTKNPIKRLKRCLRKGRSHAYSSGEEFYNAFEAAIEYAREQFEKLEVDCTTAEGEEDRLRGEVADLEAKLQAQSRTVMQLLFAMHEAERVME